MSRRLFAAWLLFMGLLCGALAPPAAATEGAWAEREMARARLIAATDAVGDAKVLSFGLEIELQPGWKTYWRSPGDAGIPVGVDWAASDNVAAVEFLWPAPLRFVLFGLDTFGYEDQVVFPLVVTPRDPGRPVTLTGSVSYMVCKDVCIPFDETLTLTLPAGPAQPTPAAYEIESFRARVPGDGSAAGLSLRGASLGGSVDAPLLRAEVASRIPFAAPDLIVEGPPGYVFKAPQVTLSDDGKSATLVLPVTLGPQAGQPLEGAPLTLTLTDGRRALETRLTPDGSLTPAADALALPVALAAVAAPDDAGTYLAILGLALLGGLILNLMPCVLPVLSLKLLSVAAHGGRARGEIRRGFLASAAGILVSFLVLAGGVLALRGAGEAVGWGLQFQVPLFLAAMAMLVTLFAGNLFGFFEIPLPGTVAGAAHHGSLKGHFATGLLATLLATPCSAPFLGTAISFALAQPAAGVLAIFLAMGLGLALPYLAVALLPGLAARLPRPGRWMIWLRRALGLLLLGTAAWLLLVLERQLGLAATLGLAALLLALLALLAWRRHARGGRRLLAGLAVAVALGGLLLPLALPRADAEVAAPAAGWVAFDEAAIPRLLAQGRTVFVDVTADWCVTCKANKTLVLDTPSVRAALDRPGVVAMQADWTRPDPAIAAFLQRFGRYGIPFNVVFTPAAPQGRPLPELLSEAAVLEALGS